MRKTVAGTVVWGALLAPEALGAVMEQ